MTSLLRPALALAAAALLSGCVGIYDNTGRFLNPPDENMAELEMLRTYGAPAYSGFVENEKVYIYKIRKNAYYVLVGIYEGRDVVVTCDGGRVVNVTNVERPKTFTILQPLPWAEAE